METLLEPGAVLDALADLLAPRIAARLPEPPPPQGADLVRNRGNQAADDGAVVWLTTRAAARRWNLKPAYLENLRVKGGGPPFVKVGNIVRYSSAAGDLWLVARTRKSTAGDAT